MRDVSKIYKYQPNIKILIIILQCILYMINQLFPLHYTCMIHKIIYSINSKYKRNVTQELLLAHFIIFDRNC